MDRRTALAKLGALSGVCLWGDLATGEPPEPPTPNVSPTVKAAKHLLRAARAAGATDRVEVVFEVAGSLNVANVEDLEKGKTKSLPMSVDARLAYDEKTLAAADTASSVRSVRHYDKAEATLRIGDEMTKTSLSESRRRIGAAFLDNRVTMFCPESPLSREELDLISPPGNSLAADHLLPREAVAVGDAWKNTPSALALVCGLDSADSCDVESRLVEVVDNVARIEMAGRLDGLVDGLKTSLELKAKCRFDLTAKRMTWLGLVLKENRKAGLIGPGLEVVARLQMKIAPGISSKSLADKSLADLPAKPTAEQLQLEYVPPGRSWRVRHDRDWVVINEKNDAVLLRRRLKDNFVAQCNISYLASPPAGKPLSLAIFQDDIRESLGKTFGSFVKASESAGADQSSRYRVDVRGEVQGVAIDWIYYLQTHASGARAIAVFTVESSTRDEFGDAGNAMMQTLRIDPSRVAAKPKDAAEK